MHESRWKTSRIFRQLVSTSEYNLDLLNLNTDLLEIDKLGDCSDMNSTGGQFLNIAPLIFEISRAPL